jgi:hypothetical protein
MIHCKLTTFSNARGALLLFKKGGSTLGGSTSYLLSALAFACLWAAALSFSRTSAELPTNKQSKDKGAPLFV